MKRKASCDQPLFGAGGRIRTDDLPITSRFEADVTSCDDGPTLTLTCDSHIAPHPVVSHRFADARGFCADCTTPTSEAIALALRFRSQLGQLGD